MPIYEYACPACATAFEALVFKKSDEAEVECPDCHSRKVDRQISRPAATRTGSGGGGGSGRAARSDCGPVG
jgi:putative FmdB family regulatory protein